jgi:RimJ/RimL family protein N-acetyltransferase
MTAIENRTYPRTLSVDSGEITARMMTADDREVILSFARKLPTHDLLFLPRDIGQPKVIDAWIRENDRGTMTSLLAVDGTLVIGCATIARDPLSWSPHVGELRVVIAPEAQGRGIGRKLTQEAFAIALSLGLQKLVAQMTVDQKGAIAVLEGIGFRAEGLLREHVQDPAAMKHDIVILSHDVAEVQARFQSFGLSDAVGAI